MSWLYGLVGAHYGKRGEGTAITHKFNIFSHSVLIPEVLLRLEAVGGLGYYMISCISESEFIHDSSFQKLPH